MKTLRSLWLPIGYYFSWCVFGLGGLALNLACVPLLLCPGRERHCARIRAASRRMFEYWLRWMNYSGVILVTWRGFDRPLPAGTVYVANHPSLVDATFLLARLPDAVCIFKPALLRNPFIAPTALMSGYVAGDRGVDLIREAAQQVAAGKSLLIFPEGTRTRPGEILNPLKHGFALIAQRAHAPIQIIRVQGSPGLGRKGHAWWRLPELPGRFEFSLDALIPSNALDTPATLTERVSTRLRSTLPAGPSRA